jgi:hypothetical protein
MNTDEVIQVIATALGAPDLKLDEQGCARLRIDDTIDVNFEASRSSHLLHVYCTLGPVPTSDRERTFEQFLTANLFGAETGGATLAIDAEFNEIVLCTDIGNHGWTAELIMSRLQRFIDAAQGWRERFAAIELEADGESKRAVHPPDIAVDPGFLLA